MSDEKYIPQIFEELRGISDSVGNVKTETAIMSERLESVRQQVEEIKQTQSHFATKEDLKSLSETWREAFRNTASADEVNNLKKNFEEYKTADKQSEEKRAAEIAKLNSELAKMQGTIAFIKWGVPGLLTLIGLIIAIIQLVK